MNRLLTSIVLTWLTLAASLTGAQTVISVNFAGGRHFANTGGLTEANIDIPDLLPDESAGVISALNWNNVARSSDNMNRAESDPNVDDTVLNLVDQTGAPTNVDVSFVADNTWRSTKEDINVDGAPQSAWLDSQGNPRSDEKMMTGYIDVSGRQDFVSFTASEIPFPAYDLFVYVGASGNDRTHTLNLVSASLDPSDTTVWYKTLSEGAGFTGPADYVRATGTTQATAAPGNYVLFENLADDALTVTMTRPPNSGGNGGLHGFQIVQRVAPSILRINTLTGQAFLAGGDQIPVDINGIEIDAADGSLLPDGYLGLGQLGIDAVDGPADPDDIPGNSPGESWELVFASPQRVVEGFLFGSTLVDVDTELSLGQVFAPGLSDDAPLTFHYTQTNGITYEGVVEFFASLEGDFTGDNAVDGADLLLWQQQLGAAGTSPADGNGDGLVDGDDLAIWEQQFGFFGAGAAASAVAIPEPVTGILVGMAAAMGPLSGIVRRRRRPARG